MTQVATNLIARKLVETAREMLYITAGKIMKRVRILVPTYNEEKNVEALANAIINHFETELKEYDYFINFIDNKSTDHTRDIIRNMCAQNQRIKAIFNAKNFGQFNSPFHGLLQNDIGGGSDCTIIMCADFQDPVDMIKKFVLKWEEGYQVVAGIKTKSKENKIMRFLRSIYYKMIKKMSSVQQIEHFTGFALYDNSFIDVLKTIDDPTPFIRGLVAELCGNIATIEYTQQKRKAGKTKNNFKTLYDAAMLSVTTYTKRIPRCATIFGGILSGLSFAGLIATIVLYCVLPGFNLGWVLFSGLAFIGFLNMFFIGMLGEYIVNMNTRLLHRPLAVEQERLNCDADAPKVR